jgi:hypothetical protein
MPLTHPIALFHMQMMQSRWVAALVVAFVIVTGVQYLQCWRPFVYELTLKAVLHTNAKVCATNAMRSP